MVAKVKCSLEGLKHRVVGGEISKNNRARWSSGPQGTQVLPALGRFHMLGGH